jgi:hypothetical protein
MSMHIYIYITHIHTYIYIEKKSKHIIPKSRKKIPKCLIEKLAEGTPLGALAALGACAPQLKTPSAPFAIN